MYPRDMMVDYPNIETKVAISYPEMTLKNFSNIDKLLIGLIIMGLLS